MIISSLKKWLERLLIFNLFFVIISSIFFILSVILNMQGYSKLIVVFQFFWKPIFLPAITCFILGILFNGFISMLPQQEP